MNIRKLFRKRKFRLGKKENEHIKHFLANFGIDIDNVMGFHTEEGVLCVEEEYEIK